MATKPFLVNIDLNKNELLNTKLQNLATHPTLTAGDAGFLYWNTTDKTAYWWTGTAWISLSTPDLLTSDIPVVLANGKTLGKYTTGQTIPGTGLTLEAVLRDIALEYVNAVFTSFSVSQQQTIEVGTTLSGSKTFTWSISANSGTVATLDIYDATAAADLLAGTANDGTQVITITTNKLDSNGATQSWYGHAYDTGTNPTTFNSPTFTVTSRYYAYYGPTATLISPPGTASANRTYAQTLSTSFKTSGANTITLVTGTSEVNMVVLLPPGVTITSVTDTTNLNANLTNDYILIDTVQINDAGGTARTYNRYELTLGTPYPVSANHVIVTT